MPHKPGTGAIRGIVSEDGFPAQKRVTLLDRTNFRQLSTIVSGVDGDYTFSGLDTTTDDYMLFSVDDDREEGSQYKDPIIYDRVRPVEAAMAPRQINDWFYLTQSRNILAAFVPITASKGSTLNSLDGTSGFSSSRPLLVSGQQLDGSYITKSPVIQQLGNVRFNNCIVAIPMNIQSHSMTTLNPITIEWVLDLSQVSGNPVIYHSVSADHSSSSSVLTSEYNEGTTNDATGVNAYVGYISNRRTIQMGYNTQFGTSNTLHLPFSDALSSNSSFSDRTVEYVLPENLLGTTIHIMAVIQQGSGSVKSCIYINGTLAAEKFLTATRNNYSSTSLLHIMSIGGSLKTNGTRAIYGEYTNADHKTSLAAIYNKIFTANEVLEHYNALFNTQRTPVTPKETGYQYAVKMLRPFIYFPMNEAETESGALSVAQHITNKPTLSRTTAQGTVKPTLTSYVLGRTSLSFNNGALTAYNTLSPPLPVNGAASIAFTAAPASATVAGTSETIFKVVHASYNSTFGDSINASWSVYRNASGKWVVQLGSTIVFNTLPEIGVEHHYAIVVDRHLSLAKLYVDGVKVEEIAMAIGGFPNNTARAAFYSGQYMFNVRNQWSIGASLNIGTNTVDAATFYKGVLSNLSIHPFAFSDDEVEDLYDFIDVM